jgi:hypothetical protein
MKIKINSKHPISLIKLNYNCPKDEKDGTGPGSCSDNAKPIDKKTEQKVISKNINQLHSIINNILNEPGTDSDLMTSDANFLGMEIGVRPSDTFKKIAIQYGIKSEIPLKQSFELVKDISKGDQDIARERIYAAFENDGNLKKALEIQMEVETTQLLKRDITLYRKGGYHENTIESYTTNRNGANMKWMSDPDEYIGTDFYKTPEQLIKDGWKVLSGINTRLGFIGESEVILINTKDLQSKNIKRSYDPEEVWDRIETNARDKDAFAYEIKIRTTPVYPNKINDTQIELKHKTVDRQELSDTYAKLTEQIKTDRPLFGDPIQEGIQKLIKFDSPPKIISKEFADKLIADGNHELLLITDKKSNDTYKTGIYAPIIEPLNVLTPSTGMPGSNTVDKIKETFNKPDYSNYIISRIILSKDAKIVEEKDLRKIVEEKDNKKASISEKYNNLRNQIYNSGDSDWDVKIKDSYIKETNESKENGVYNNIRDYNLLAMSLGYDAIQLSNFPSYSLRILNRGSVYVQQDTIPASKHIEIADYVENQQEKQYQAFVKELRAKKE